MTKISEEVNALKTQVALIEQANETIFAKLDKIEAKIDLSNKVNEIHAKVMTPGDVTGLQRFGTIARNIKDIAIGAAITITVLGILMKVDFSTIIK